MKKQHSARICVAALILTALSAGVAAKCDEPERMEAPTQNRATQTVRECESDNQAEPSERIPYREDVSALFYADELEAEWQAVKQAMQQSAGKVVEAEPEEIATYWEHIPLSADVQGFIFAECEKRDINPELVFAIIWQESSYRADAIGGGGNAIGLMQIWESTHKDRMKKMGVTDLFDPIQNATIGIDYLDELIKKYDGNIPKALVAYNCGPTGANRSYFSKGIFSSTYSKAVLDKCEKLKT